MVPKERQADMNSREYLTEVLRYYRSSFDVSLPYSLGGRDYEALAEFHASTEKYILVRQFRLWSENTDEFVLFSLFEGGAPTLEDISALQASIREHMEPLFVRGGKEKLHDENHMYTYLTMALYCDTMPEENVIRAVKKTRFKKYYEHGMSGYSEGHIYLRCAENGRCWTNPDGREIKRLFKLVDRNLAKREKAQREQEQKTGSPIETGEKSPN